MSNIEFLLNPRTVAIVGDTPGEGRGGLIHEQLIDMGFEGEVYPINPKYEEVRGLRCYPSLCDVPGPIDFAAIALGAPQASRLISECAEKGVKAALFIASGFAEAGSEGQRLQNRLREVALDNGIAVCGPNCYGVANFHGRFVAYGGPLARPIRPGATALIFQSGALTHGATDPAVLRGVGYSYIITTGNEAVTELSEYLDYIVDDENTRVIACFVEGFKDPERFRTAAEKAIQNDKRIIVLKAGRSALARQATIAHTGSLAGEDRVYDSLLRKLGIVRVNDLDELVETAELLTHVPRIGKGNIGIASISGGSCAVIADLAQDVGLQLGTFSPRTAEHLKRILPPFGSTNNPLDLTGAVGENPDILKDGLRALIADREVEAVAFAMNTPTATEERGRALYQQMARNIADVAEKTTKPVIMFTMSSGSFDPDLVTISHGARMPLLQGIRETLKAMASVKEASRAIDRWSPPDKLAGPAPSEVLENFYSCKRSHLTERASKKILKSAGIPVTQELLARSEEEAVAKAIQIGFPVALKVESPDIAHKTEAGCVYLNLDSPESVGSAYKEILDNARLYDETADLHGVIVQEMVPGGIDILIGAVNYEGIGPAVVFGLGGIWVEALSDVVMRMAPVSTEEAYEMLGAIRGASLLEGFRGRPASDIEALVDVIVRVSKIAWWLRHQFRELDVNPVRVLAAGEGARVLDALIVCEEKRV